MNRIQRCFDNLKQQNRKGLIPYITAGDPHPNFTVPLLHGLVEAGADIIEIGVPFSDPMADGPAIQKAVERALAYHTSTQLIFSMVKNFRQTNQQTPIILMGYLNPIEQLGYQLFAEQAAQAGVDGVLIVDCPPEESAELKAALEAHQLDMIFLMAPTTTPERLKIISAAASGYLYYVSLKGVTGSSQLDVASVDEKMQQIRQASDLPVCVGFGIKDANTAKKIAPFADAVVVGSALIESIAKKLIEKNLVEPIPAEALTIADFQPVFDLIKTIREAI